MIEAQKLGLMMVFVLLLTSHLSAQAQELSTEGWPIEQQCLGEPTTSPEGWKWEGQIYVEGIEGIRVLDAYYATPYFALFDSPFISAAALSPNGKWYAVPAGYQGYETMTDNSYVVQGIEVVSTDTERNRYFIPWQYHGRGFSAIYNIPRLHWVDTESLLYMKGYAGFSSDLFEIDPFSGIVTQIDNRRNPATAYFSPDGERVLRYEDKPAANNYQPGWIMYTLTGQISPTTLTYPSETIGKVVWLPDSSGFVADYRNTSKLEGESPLILTLYNNHAKLSDVIFVGGAVTVHQNLVFSEDGRYLSFTDRDNHLYLVDMVEKFVIRTCLTLDKGWFKDSLAWQPDAHRLSFRSQGGVVVFDVDAHTIYRIAEKIGYVVDWGLRD